MTKRIPSAPSLGALLLAAALLPSGAALAAEGIPIEPGKWKIESERITTLNGTKARPMHTTEEVCMDETLSVEDLSAEAEGQCTSKQVTAGGNRLEWSLHCPAPGGEATGKAVYEVASGGKKVTGTTKMEVTGQMKMSIVNESTGTHLGPCD